MAKKKKITNPAKRACKMIQQWARLNETDKRGNGYCYSCGAQTNYWESNGGHFQPKGRGYNAACIDKRNVHMQCLTCNMTMEGNSGGYAHHLILDHGQEIIEELFLLAKHPGERQNMLDAIDEFKVLNKVLCKAKDFEVKAV